MRCGPVSLVLAVLLAACGGEPAARDAAEPSRTASAATDMAGGERLESPVQDPRGLYLLPCGGAPVVPGERPGQCVLAIAGGKRFLFGAPAGAAMTLSLEDLRYLDAVFLPSLASKDIEGLDELRRASWAAGRQGNLTVYGPEGLGETVILLNEMHKYGDAIATMDDGARGFRDLPLGVYAFRLADLTPEAGPLMDRGDVAVFGGARDGLRLGFRIVYRGGQGPRVAWIAKCPPEGTVADALIVDGEMAETACGWGTGLRVAWPGADGPLPSGWRAGVPGRPVSVGTR